MSKQFWIDGNGDEAPGNVGFLVRISNEIGQGPDRTTLRDEPACTNQSCEPRVWGWCGTYNNTRCDACGVGRVVRVAGNGRVKVEQVEDRASLKAFLEDVGYPELIDEALEG